MNIITLKINIGHNEISFIKSVYDLYKIILNSSNETYTIPLLLDIYQVLSTIEKLYDVKKEIESFDLLKGIVAGAASISIVCICETL